MMKEKVADEGSVGDVRLPDPFESVGGHDLRLPPEFAEAVEDLGFHEVDPIHKDDFELAGVGGDGAGKLEKESSVSGSEFDDGLDPAIGMTATPCFDQSGHVPHEHIDAAEV